MATGPQGPGANDRIFPNLWTKELSADHPVAHKNLFFISAAVNNHFRPGKRGFQTILKRYNKVFAA